MPKALFQIDFVPSGPFIGGHPALPLWLDGTFIPADKTATVLSGHCWRKAGNNMFSRDVDCRNAIAPFVCQRDLFTVTEDSCANGWDFAWDACYRIFTEDSSKASCNDAFEHCVQQGEFWLHIQNMLWEIVLRTVSYPFGTLPFLGILKRYVHS